MSIYSSDDHGWNPSLVLMSILECAEMDVVVGRETAWQVKYMDLQHRWEEGPGTETGGSLEHSGQPIGELQVQGETSSNNTVENEHTQAYTRLAASIFGS